MRPCILALLASLSLLLPASALADPPAAAKPAAPVEAAPKPLPETMLGAWAVDIRATLDGNADLAKMPPEAQAQVRAQSEMVLGGMRFEFTADGRAIAAMRGQAQTSRYTVAKRDGDTAVLTMTDPDGRDHEMRITLKDGRLHLSEGAQSLVLMRPPPEAKAPADAEPADGKKTPATPPKK